VHERAVPRERGLGDRREPKALGREQEVPDVHPAVERAVDTLAAHRGDDGRVRSAEQVEVPQRLAGRRRAVAAGDANRVVELPAALAPSLVINPVVAAGPRKVRVHAAVAPLRLRPQRAAEALGALARGDDHLPGLRVAPGRGPLREPQQPLDRAWRHWAVEKGATTVPRDQQVFEHAGRICGHLNTIYSSSGSCHRGAADSRHETVLDNSERARGDCAS